MSASVVVDRGMLVTRVEGSALVLIGIGDPAVSSCRTGLGDVGGGNGRGRG